MAGTDRTRRGVVVAGVGIAAAAAGGAIAWKRLTPAAPADGAAQALWQQTFDAPDGGPPLAMAALRGKPLLVNFWATWCAPCVEELPMLDRFHRDNAASGWQVVGLAIDQPSSVRKFLARTPVAFPVGMAGLEGTDLAKALGNSVGGLPFTVVLDAGGRVRERKMGQLQSADLAAWKAAHGA